MILIVVDNLQNLLRYLQTLMEYGVDIISANKYGFTPVYYASNSSHWECVAFLLAAETAYWFAHQMQLV